MKKSLVPVSLAISLLGGCAVSSQPNATSSAGTTQSTTATASTQPSGNERSVWVPPPAGSLLGGGFVRIANDTGGNDEPGLVSAINFLNASAGSKVERQYVVSAVARVSGLSERQVQAQQDQLQLRFGELLAFNTIARNHEAKVRELASLKATGKTWTELAKANATSIAAVAQTVRNAQDITASSYTNAAERAKGGQRKLQEMGVRPHAPPPGG